MFETIKAEIIYKKFYKKRKNSAADNGDSAAGTGLLQVRYR